jgi:predicted SAM-dependent methyltransferase
MLLRNTVASLLHVGSFTAEPSARAELKREFVGENLRLAFAKSNNNLGRDARIETINPRRWKLADRESVYLIKDHGDELAVVREVSPFVCGVIEFFTFKAKPKFDATRWRARQMSLQCRWTAQKRWREQPQKLLVNIGSGSWYVPNWKIMECRGSYYKFHAPGFIDYNHDLTGNAPFPLADGSVHLFYCEHVVEHLKDEWCENLFREAFRTLEPGGGFRIVMPDADLIYERFIKRDSEFFKSWMERDNSTLEEAFCTLVAQSRHLDKAEIDDRLASMGRDEFLDWCKRGLDYDWKKAGEHINWFSFEKLSRMLHTAGFCDVRRTDAQESRFLEARGPKFDTRAWYSLHVDCGKREYSKKSAHAETREPTIISVSVADQHGL